MSRHKIEAGQRNYVTTNNEMSQQSSDKTPWLKEKFYCDKEFFYHNIIEKIVKNTVATILDSVVTTIKAESKEAMSREYNFCLNIKS